MASKYFISELIHVGFPLRSNLQKHSKHILKTEERNFSRVHSSKTAVFSDTQHSHASKAF
jgi:hypothetical protein